MRLRRQTSTAVTEPLFPLIDVMFFLLVFFLLVGRMDATAPFEVIPAKSAGGSDLPGGGATLSVGADGTLALDGQAMIEADILTALRFRLGEEEGLQIRINAHADAVLYTFLPLIGQIEAAGAQEVVLVVSPDPSP